VIGASATKGNWQDVWSSFDQRRKAKGEPAGANDVAVDAGAEPDMFGGAGGAQAAE
jgi:ribonucleoside-diphosphate reductase beta chain